MEYTGTGTAPDIGAYEFEGMKDTVDLSPLHGVYTINNTSPTNDRNFNTFEEAIFTLNNRGISGAVVFEVTAGQVFNILLTDYRGLSITTSGTEDKPVTFRKSGAGSNPLLRVRGTSHNSDVCFYLNGVNYFTFDGLDIVNAGNMSSNDLERGFVLNNTSHISIVNCAIRSNQYGIFTTGDLYAFHSDNVTIKNAYCGYYLSSRY